MRVVRIVRRGEGPEESFDLHAHLTVVTGLDPDTRSWLVDAIGRIDGSQLGSAAGELEASGVVLPLDAESLGLLGIDDGVDAVVDARRLSGSLGSADDGTDEGSDADRAPGTAGGTDTAADVRPDDETEPDPHRGSASTAFVPETPLQRRIAALSGRRDELQRLAATIPEVDVTGVVAALAALDDAPTGVPVADAAELAHSWDDLQKDLGGLALGTSEQERAALDAVEQAKQAVADAEEALRKPQLDDEMVTRIEAAHAAYLDATDKMERRFGGGRARRQLAEAEAEETALLSSLGFESWVDYVLTASKRTEDPEMATEHADLEAAQTELQVCVAELDAIPGAVGRRHRRARLRERQAELDARITRLLGEDASGEDVGDRLRAMTTPYDAAEEVAALRAAMADAGIGVDGRTDRTTLADRARHATAAQLHADKRRAELMVAVDALDEALVTLRAAVEAGEAAVPSMPALPDMAEPPVAFVDMFDHDEVDSARLFEVDEASPIDGDPRATPDTDGDDAADHPFGDGGVPGAGAASEEPQLPLGLDPVAEPPDTATATASAAPVVQRSPQERAALVDDVHWEAMLAIAAASTDGPAGQFPVVFDDPFTMLGSDDCVEVLGRLIRLTDHVQVVVVTDRPEVSDWARAIGAEHAAVLEVAR